MEYLIALLFLVLAVTIFVHIRKQHLNLPPCPLPLPIIGHLHLLKQPIHRTFHELSQKYGPIVSLKLGSQLAVIVSSPSLAEECFTTNDAVLSGRPNVLMAKYLHYNSTTMGSIHYGDHYRMLRRISYTEVLSPASLNSFSDIRRDEVRALLRRLYSTSSHGFAKVRLRPMLMDLTFNIMMRMVAGKQYYGDNVSEGNEEEARVFREMLEKQFEMASTTHPSDLFPMLRWFDYDGYVKKLKIIGEKTDELLQKLVDEHRVDQSRDSMISRLLRLQETQSECYPDETIKGLILIFLLGGTETVAKSLEWTMSNLLNHPEVLVRAQQELDSQIGQDRLINETDLPKLLYLQSILAENMRLYPVAPFLIPRVSSADCSIGGYHVPGGSMVFVNAWTIQRDAESWEDPLSFKPERFKNGTYKEYTSKMFPFGKGKRMCPGEGLGNRQLGLVLGSLIQCFEWKRVDDESEINMAEEVVINMTKLVPLEAMCKARQNLQIFLSD